MSLDSFFSSLDTEHKFDVWKKVILGKLKYLSDQIPLSNKLEHHYILETIEFLNSLTLINSSYASNFPDTGNKENIVARLKMCNHYYRKFGGG